MPLMVEEDAKDKQLGNGGGGFVSSLDKLAMILSRQNGAI
jgi:hypothetical protein